MEYDHIKNKPEPPDYLADLYTQEEWDQYLLTIEMGMPCVNVHFLVATPVIRAKLKKQAKEAKENPQPTPKPKKKENSTMPQKKPSKFGVNELAKRITKDAPDLAIKMLKKQRESEED